MVRDAFQSIRGERRMTDDDERVVNYTTPGKESTDPSATNQFQDGDTPTEETEMGEESGGNSPASRPGYPAPENASDRGDTGAAPDTDDRTELQGLPPAPDDPEWEDWAREVLAEADADTDLGVKIAKAALRVVAGDMDEATFHERHH